MNVKITSAKGTNLGNFRTVDGITYFNPSKQLQSAFKDAKYPTSQDEWQQVFKLLSTSTVEELLPEDVAPSSFDEL